MADVKRMALKNDEFLSEFGGRLPAGSAVDVPEALADKWQRLHIAEPAKKGALLARDARRAELQAELAALEQGPVYDTALTSETTGVARPRGRPVRAATVQPTTEGAEQVNGPDELEDEDEDDDGKAHRSGKK